MYWILQALNRLGVWLDRLLDSGERAYLVTLHTQSQMEWRVEVLAENLDDARDMVRQEYPAHRIVAIEPLE